MSKQNLRTLQGRDKGAEAEGRVAAWRVATTVSGRSAKRMGTIISGMRRACACAAAPARHQVRVPATEARREQLVSRYEVSSNPADGARLLIRSAP